MSPRLAALGRFLLYGTTEKPLLLTCEIIPDESDWRRVNILLDHRRGCRCSTCSLAASLGVLIRQQEGLIK